MRIKVSIQSGEEFTFKVLLIAKYRSYVKDYTRILITFLQPFCINGFIPTVKIDCHEA